MSIKVGVIGVGHLGRHHARIYSGLRGVELYAVIDRDKGRAEDIARQYGGRAYSDYKKAINGLQALSIVTPTSLHYDIALRCLRAGKDLLIEKPIAGTVKEADALLREAGKRGAILQVGHLERYNPAVLAASGLIDSPVFFEAERVSPFLGRAVDVDVTLDLMIHDIDIIFNFLNGPKVLRLNAAGGSIVTDKLDFATAWLEFQGGASCLIKASRVSENTQRKLRVFNKNSCIVLDYQKKDIKRYFKTPAGIREESITPPEAEPLKEELRDFIDCVISRRRPMVSGREGRNALEIAIKITDIIKNKIKNKGIRRIQ